MAARKKLVRKDVIRLARQKLWVDIGKALDSYEKHVYGDLALLSPRSHGEPHASNGRDICQECAHFREEHHDGHCWRPCPTPFSSTCPCESFVERELREETKEERESRRRVELREPLRATDISTVEEIEKILPPEPPRRSSRARKPSPVSDYIHDDDGDRGGAARAERDEVTTHGALGSSEEKVLILIVQSHGGMTPAQIAIKIVKLKKRTIQNILTELKSRRFIIKDENHGKFRATEEGKTAVKDRYVPLPKGAILEELSESEKKVLFAIASKKEGVTLSAISVMVPKITKRTKQNIITALKTRELIEKLEDSDRFVLTAHAREELKGKLAKPLTGKALREYLGETLPETQAIVLDVLHTSDSGAMSLSQIAHVLNGRCTLRTVQNIMTALKAQELVLKREDGCFELAPTLRG